MYLYKELFPFSKKILLFSVFIARSLFCAHILFIIGVIPFSVVENIQVSRKSCNYYKLIIVMLIITIIIRIIMSITVHS